MDHHLLLAGWQLLLALFSGVVIGVERQISSSDERKHFGIRDFALIALLAFVSSYLAPVNPSIWPIAFFGVMTLSIFVFVLESLWRKTQDNQPLAGITTVLSFPVVFLIASLSVFNIEFWLIATILFALLIILELKDKWHQLASTIEKRELFDFSILIAIALIITPLVPHDAALKIPLYSFSEHLFVFQHVDIGTFWKVLLMVSFMSFIAHFITKYIKGRNALLLATFFGGLVSSLATIILFLRGTTETDGGEPKNLYLAYLAASTGSLFKDTLILFAILPVALFQKMLFPVISILIVMVALTLVSFSRTVQTEEVRFTDRPLPFKFVSEFSIIFSVVMIMMVLVRFYLGSGWLVMASFFSGLVSSAAALASLGEAFRLGEITPVVVGAGVLVALLGSITAKYAVVSRHLGMRHSMKFLLPITYFIGVGGLAFSVTFF